MSEERERESRHSGEHAAGRPSEENAAGRPSGENAAGRPSGENAVGRPSGENVAGKPSGERPREGMEYVERERGDPSAGQIARTPGGRFYTTKPTLGSMREGTGAYSTAPGVAERPIDEELTRELGVPVEKRVAEEEGLSRERPVIVERSSYERLPHEPVGPGIGGEGILRGLGTRGPPEDKGKIEKEGGRMVEEREKVDEGYAEGGLEGMGRKLGMTA